MGQKHPVTYIEHEDITVYVWDLKEGVETISHCLVNHPDEPIISVGIINMTEKQYKSLPDYDGDC